MIKNRMSEGLGTQFIDALRELFDRAIEMGEAGYFDDTDDEELDND